MKKNSIHTRAELGAMLKKQRTAAGITMRDMAAKLGIEHTRIADMEAGRVSGMDMYLQYVEGLDGCLYINWNIE